MSSWDEIRNKNKPQSQNNEFADSEDFKRTREDFVGKEEPFKRDREAYEGKVKTNKYGDPIEWSFKYFVCSLIWLNWIGFVCEFII